MHQAFILLISALLSFTIFASENPLEKTFLLSLPTKTLNADTTRTIQLFSLTLAIQNMPERIKILHYLAHQNDQHQQNIFNIIYQADTKIMDSIARQLFSTDDPPSIDHRMALCRGDFLTPAEYSSKNTAEEILFLKYNKAISYFVEKPVLQYDYHKKQKEIELRISEILKVSKKRTELGIKKLLDSHGSKKLKSIILRSNFSGPCDELSPIISDLLLRTCFSVEDTSILLNFAMIVTAYESQENKGLFLNQLLKNFIHKHQQKSIDDRCRFIVIFTLLLHHRYLPASYRTDYIDILFNNINDLFPTQIKPNRSLVSYIDDLHGTEYEPTILHYGCKFALIDVINFILEKDNIAPILNKPNHKGKTPLMLLCKSYFPYAIHGNNYTQESTSKKMKIFSDILKKCIAKGANLLIQDNKGKSIEHYIFENICIKDPNDKIVKELKEICEKKESSISNSDNVYLSFKTILKKYFSIFLKWLNLPFFLYC